METEVCGEHLMHTVIVIELPIRDGNTVDTGNKEIKRIVIELPIRDGNYLAITSLYETHLSY